MMPFQEHGNSIGSKLFCPAEAVKNCRMQIPTLWECLEVFQLRKELAQEKYLIPLDGDCARELGCDASAKLQKRLTIHSRVCLLLDEKSGRGPCRTTSFGEPCRQRFPLRNNWRGGLLQPAGPDDSDD